jgi:hypothetical protein
VAAGKAWRLGVGSCAQAPAHLRDLEVAEALVEAHVEVREDLRAGQALARERDAAWDATAKRTPGRTNCAEANGWIATGAVPSTSPSDTARVRPGSSLRGAHLANFLAVRVLHRQGGLLGGSCRFERCEAPRCVGGAASAA